MPGGGRGSQGRIAPPPHHGPGGGRSYISRPMSPVRMGRAAPLFLLVLAACPDPEPAVVRASLEPTADTLIAPYAAEVAVAAWLGGSRWVVLSPQDRAVDVADFGSRRLAPFATRPRELEQPFHLFRAGDSLYIGDWQRRRLTAWSLTGVLSGSLPAATQYRGALPHARDAQGRWYFELRPPPGRDGSGNRDSALILRTDLVAHTDTAARLAPFDLVEVVSEGRRRLERRLLSGQDRWGVLPDGTVWVARVTDNRVDWHHPGGVRRTGRALPDRVLPITEPDRELFLSRFDAGLRASVSQIPFAAIKPPFEGALTDPAGRLWLVKSRAVGDTLRHYQVLDTAGVLREELSHPGLGRILALSDREALVAEPFERGVRLLRFRRPAPAPAAAAP